MKSRTAHISEESYTLLRLLGRLLALFIEARTNRLMRPPS
jgi:hypothetical protein